MGLSEGTSSVVKCAKPLLLSLTVGRAKLLGRGSKVLRYIEWRGKLLSIVGRVALLLDRVTVLLGYFELVVGTRETEPETGTL